MTSYIKSTREYFPDLCDQRVYGNISGYDYSYLTKNIINNHMTWSNQLSGYKNPGWVSAIRRGESATTPMTAEKSAVNGARKCLTDIRTSQIVAAPGNWQSYEWKGYPYYLIPNSAVLPPGLQSEVRNIALSKFLKRANDVRSGTQFGETLGEWKETVRAITRPLATLRDFTIGHVKNAKKRMRRYYENAHGGRLRPNYRSRHGAEAAAKALAGTYLEFNFGWIPLVKSINDATNSLLDRNDRPKTVIVSGKGGRDFDGSNQEMNVFQFDNILVYQDRKSYSTVSHQYRACIETGVVDNTRSVAQSLGLIPERWVPTIWELIPYSFVVDYFVNIGDIIAAMSFRRSSIRWGTSTGKVRSVYNYSDLITRDVAPPGYWGVSRTLLRKDTWGGGALIERTSVDRTDILTANLVPDLTFHMPYNNKAWVNIGAILTGAFCSVW